MTNNITLPAGYTLINLKSGNYGLRCAYEEGLPSVLKRAGGKWNATIKAWVYKPESLDKMIAAVERRAAKNSTPDAVAARDAAARKVAATWLGYVAESAREGRIYDKGVAKLRGEIQITRWPELAAELDATIAAAHAKRREMEAGWAAEKNARTAAAAARRTAVQNSRHIYPVSRTPAMNTPVRYYDEIVVYTGTGKNWWQDGESGDGIVPVECWDTMCCYAYFRPATTEEACDFFREEELRAVHAEVAAAQEARRESARSEIKALWDCPATPEIFGREVHNSRNVYGGGSRVIVGPDYIWLIEGNGTDGDDWSLNNLPGEIAFRAPYSAELEAKIQGHEMVGG